MSPWTWRYFSSLNVRDAFTDSSNGVSVDIRDDIRRNRREHVRSRLSQSMYAMSQRSSVTLCTTSDVTSRWTCACWQWHPQQADTDEDLRNDGQIPHLPHSLLETRQIFLSYVCFTRRCGIIFVWSPQPTLGSRSFAYGLDVRPFPWSSPCCHTDIQSRQQWCVAAPASHTSLLFNYVATCHSPHRRICSS